MFPALFHQKFHKKKFRNPQVATNHFLLHFLFQDHLQKQQLSFLYAWS